MSQPVAVFPTTLGLITMLPFSDVVGAHRKLATLAPGHKLVLEMAGD